MKITRRGEDFVGNQKDVLDRNRHHMIDDGSRPPGYKICARCGAFAHLSGTGTAFGKECKEDNL